MTRDEFEAWLAHMDDALDRWFESVEVEARSKLDFSVPSLDVVERLLLQAFTTTKDALVPSESRRLDGFVRYTGEAMRRRLGGVWDIVLDRPSYVFFRLPIIRARGMRTDESPHSLVTAAIDRRSGTYLRQVVESHARAVDAMKAVDAAIKGPRAR